VGIFKKHMYTIEIIKDKFWIVEDAGVKLGTIRRASSSNFEVITNDALVVELLSLSALTSKFGSKILESKQIKKIEAVEYGKDLDEVEGYPCKHRAFNKRLENNIPVYTKTEKSNVLYAAGYYGLHFPGAGWKNAYCVKQETLSTYEYIGPFKSKTQLEAEILKRSKQDEV
jgi:hypothetical protein